MFASKIAFIFIAVASVSVVFAQDQQGPAGADGLGFVQALRDIGQFLSPEQREQAKSIATNPTLTKQQVIDGLKSFFQGIGGDAETKFNALFEQFKTVGQKVGEKIKENESLMSEEGKQLLSKAAEIHKNMNISFADEQQQLKEIFDSASPGIKTKIQDIFKKIQALKAQAALTQN
uniref:Uncharacterized protein n=1 Tax=Panagrolaimus sp. ES5 TaxID=591445 RepID=A0AC34FB81_9BILA